MVTANNTYNCFATFKTQSNHSTAASVICLHVFVPVAVPDGPNPRPTRRYANDVHSPTNKAFYATRAQLTVCARDLAAQRSPFEYESAELAGLEQTREPTSSTTPMATTSFSIEWSSRSLKKKAMVVWMASLFLTVVVNFYCCYGESPDSNAKLERSQSAESDTEPDSVRGARRYWRRWMRFDGDHDLHGVCVLNWNRQAQGLHARIIARHCEVRTAYIILCTNI